MGLIYVEVCGFVLVVASFSPIHVNAAVCQNKTQVVYGNGVFNSRNEAASSQIILERSLGVRVGFNPVALAYANDGGAALTLSGALPVMEQLLELFLQKTAVDNTNNFWNWISGTGSVPVPQWFLDGMEQIAVGVNAANYVLDSDVQNHVNIYTRYLNAGNKVLIVSHSQGNFFF